MTMTRESRGGLGSAVSVEKPVLLKEMIGDEENRLTTGVNEFDCVMGGGIVPGSVTLIGGDPGIGKSTLALQVVCHLSQKGHQVLYVSGEESVKQTKMRADSIIATATTKAFDNLFIVNQVDLNVIMEFIK